MKVTNTLLLIFLLSSFVLGQSGPEINSDGIIFPKMTTPPATSISTKGQIIYNTTTSKFQTFNGSLWVDLIGTQGVTSSSIVDSDGDTKIKFGESFTSVDPDEIIFETDNSRTLHLQKTASGHTRVSFPTSNMYFGNSAGLHGNSNATDNIGIGSNSLRLNETSDFNIAIGKDALKNMPATNDSSPFDGYNVAVGHQALENLEELSGYNVAVGHQAGYNGGGKSVFLGYRAGKDASKLTSSLYINNDSGDNPLIYGDFSKNSVSINYSGSAVGDALHVESDADQNPLRVRVAGNTRLRVFKNGGVTIGENQTPPAEGLRVKALGGIRKSPIFADADGNLYRGANSAYYCTVSCSKFRANDWSGASSTSTPLRLGLAPINPPIILPETLLDYFGRNDYENLHSLPIFYSQINLPEKANLLHFSVRIRDSSAENGFRGSLVRISVTDPTSVELLAEINTTKAFVDTEVRDLSIDIHDENNADVIVENEKYVYMVMVYNCGIPLSPQIDFYNAQVSFAY